MAAASQPDDKLSIGRRIREIRKWLRISQTAVAEFLGVPRSAIGALESGSRDLGLQELIKLSDLLRCEPSALLGLKPSPVASTSPVEFCARSNHMNGSIDETDQRELSNFAFVLKSLAFNCKNLNRTPASDLVNTNNPSIAAAQLINKLNITAPVDIYGIIKRIGIYPRFSALNALAGALIRAPADKAEVYGMIINSDQTETRMRFSAAHELAHYLLGHAFEKEVILSPKGRWKDPHERDADQFAAELLIPLNTLVSEINRSSMNEITAACVFQLSEKFLVSYQAMNHRLLSTNLISSVQYERFAKKKPSEIRALLSETLKPEEGEAFDISILQELIDSNCIFQLSDFSKSADWVRWLQEVAYEEYRKKTKFTQRKDEVREVYEKVALWIANNKPLSAEMRNGMRFSQSKLAEKSSEGFIFEASKSENSH